MIKGLRRFDYKLFLAIFITGLLPTIYTTVRFHFLGNIPSDWGYNIASQLQYINLMFEVLQEMLILPLFFLIGKTIQNKDETRNKIKTGSITLFGLIFMFSLTLFIFTEGIVTAMAQNTNLIAGTVSYIRYELVGVLFANLVKFFMVILILKEFKKDIYILLLIQMIFTIIFDSLFISELRYSMLLGVNGIAYTNIIVNIIMLVYVTFRVFQYYDISFKKYFNKLNFTWLKEWAKVGSFSGLESFVRNLAFMIMIIRMVNVVSEQGTYWIANTFIWSWMLLPILTLGELIKKETSQGNEAIRKNTLTYFTVTTIIVAIWIILIPLWKPFLGTIMNVADYEKVFYLVLIQLGFYIIFAYNNVMDSTFYGVGRTDYMLYQSLIVNILYYGTAYILFRVGIYTPTLQNIALLFGVGMLFDFIPTTVLYIIMLRNRNIKIEINR